ncbi:MAG: VCBS repeat-containing protein [Thermoanaerobaculia bacterium]
MKLVAALLVSGLVTPSLAAQCSGCFHPSFSPAFRAYAGETFLDIGSADFDGDGFPDLVVATGDGIGFLRGSGAGIFEAPVEYGSTGSTSIVVADFNGDGRPDAATGGGHVTVFIGNGDGTFQPGVEYVPPSNALAGMIAATDFDGDGVPDLAVPVTSLAALLIYIANGDGTFQAPETVPAPFLTFVTTGDFNGDGHQDLLGSGPSVYLGDGQGGFSAPVVSGGDGSWFAVGDFNRDGIPDLASAQFFDVLILLGNGDGSFTPGAAYPVGNGLNFIATGDFDLDGIVDLAVSVNQDGNIVVLPGSLGPGAGRLRRHRFEPLPGGHRHDCPPRDHDRLRRRELLSCQPGHARTDGRVPAEGGARIRLRAPASGRPLPRRSAGLLRRGLDRAALARGDRSGLRGWQLLSRCACDASSDGGVPAEDGARVGIPARRLHRDIR